MSTSDPKVCDNCANAPQTPYPQSAEALTREDRAWADRLARDFVEMQGRMHAQINRLRRERDELQRRLDEVPSTITALQDRIALLELRR